MDTGWGVSRGGMDRYGMVGGGEVITGNLL